MKLSMWLVGSLFFDPSLCVDGVDDDGAACGQRGVAFLSGCSCCDDA